MFKAFVMLHKLIKTQNKTRIDVTITGKTFFFIKFIWFKSLKKINHVIKNWVWNTKFFHIFQTKTVFIFSRHQNKQSMHWNNLFKFLTMLLQVREQRIMNCAQLQAALLLPLQEFILIAKDRRQKLCSLSY